MAKQPDPLQSGEPPERGAGQQQADLIGRQFFRGLGDTAGKAPKATPKTKRSTKP